MLRSLLILFFCVVFLACSSDDSVALNEWFKDHGIASSYHLDAEDIYLSVKNSFTNADTSAYLVNSSAALGNANGIEQMLYFGLEVLDSLPAVWKLRADSIFYADFYGGKIPGEKIKARFYWLEEPEIEHDTTWLKFQKKFKDSADITIDAFNIPLPKLKADTLRLLIGIKLLTDNAILRIAPPSAKDIPGLLRVAQKTGISKCERCLHAGTRESLLVAFDIKAEDKIKIARKPVVFAELVLPKSSDSTGSEPKRPVPVYVSLEDYRVDTAYVNEHKHHPNLIFWEGDSLRLQVTMSLRNYVNAANDTLGFKLRLGTPMLNPESNHFYNLRTSRVFSDRFTFVRYDFSSTLAPAKQVKLRLWFADFGDKK